MKVNLTFKERELWNAFQAYLNLAEKQTFTVDDLHEYFTEERLKEVFKDPVHDMGAFFFKLLQSGEIRVVGSKIGRYRRSIKLYQTT